MSSKSKSTHVVPNSGRDGWDSKDSGNSRASKHFENKQEAVNWTREHSRNLQNELVVHNRDCTAPGFLDTDLR